MSPAWRVVVVVLMLFAACPPPPGSDAGVDAGSPAERHCASYAEALCARLAACGTAEPGQRVACEARAFTLCDGTIGPASRAGATRVEVGATETCLAAIANAPCLFVDSSAWSSCLYGPGTRAPAGTPGTRCENADSCLEGVCGPPVSGRCGVCSPATAIGERCGTCDPQVAFCSLSGVCTAYLPDGVACVRADHCQSRVCTLAQRCGTSAQGEPCRSEFECAPSDFCSNLVLNQVPGQCQPRTDAGTACQYQLWDSAGGCARGTWCLDGRCVAPAAGSLADGAECSSHLQCAEGAACDGLFGVFSYGRCSTPQLGGPCVAEAQFCPPNGRCIDAPDGGSCRPLRGLDEPCTLEDTRWDDCKVGLACGSAGDGGARCEALRSNGRRCVRDDQCLSLRCADTVCAAPGAEGASCLSPAHCASRACVFTGGASSGQCESTCF
ncbi:MAG: hypothetical protein Q8L48_05030 [Archangium sp.]|nr:hypothetical protein [Archangium sp.]